MKAVLTHLCQLLLTKLVDCGRFENAELIEILSEFVAVLSHDNLAVNGSVVGFSASKWLAVSDALEED